MAMRNTAAAQRIERCIGFGLLQYALEQIHFLWLRLSKPHKMYLSILKMFTEGPFIGGKVPTRTVKFRQ